MDSKLHLELIQREIDFYIKLKNTRDSLWSNRLSIWIKKIIDKN